MEKAPMLGAVLRRTSPGVVVRSLIIVSDDWWLDEQAILRWADDGGRWVDGNNATVQEAQV